MGEIIRSWLQSRLGVIIDLTPEVFGHYSRDGTLLAKLLYNYDIINETQLETITRTKDPALARINLKHLRAWSKFIGVNFDDKCLEDISNGRGTASLRVFYKLFLCLEMKDRLHFITLQKERERYIPNSTKFEVSVVPELPPPAEPLDHPLSAELVRNVEVIEWHRKKFLEAIQRSKHFTNSSLPSQISEEIPEKTPRATTTLEIQEEIGRNEFSGIDSMKSSRSFDKKRVKNPLEARKYVKSLSHRRSRAAAAEDSKLYSQKKVLSSIWGRIEESQNRKIDETICRSVLRESQYEKQMLKKLCEIRKDKDRISDTRKLVESLMQKSKEESFRFEEEKRREDLRVDTRRIDDERKRLMELDLRVNNKRVQESEEYLQELGRKLMEDLTDIAMSSGDYRIFYSQDVPRRVWRDWKALFIQGLSLLPPDEELPTEILRGEGEEIIARSSEWINREELLDRRDLEEYLKLSGPWEEFLPENEENLGRNVLGYIVHRLLGLLHPQDYKSPPLQEYPVQGVLLGLPESSLDILRDFLSSQGIEIVQVKETVDYCLRRYKEEIKDFKFVDLELNRRNGSSQSSQINETDQKSNKNTQTPRIIPYEDLHPLLSDAAFLGKTIHELLTHGNKIPEKLIAKTIILYLKSLNTQGWVIIDYPETYQQMIHLESELSGGNEEFFDSKGHEDENEELEGVLKSSRLVPNPLAPKNRESNSHLTIFVRMREKSRISEDENEVEKFYISQGLALVFPYASGDFEALEELSEVITKDLRTTGQLERSLGSLESFEDSRQSKTPEEGELRPGDPSWNYADLPQDENNLEELALCWINLESSCISGLTEILSLKRFTFLTVLPYKDFIVKYLLEFAGQDFRQQLLRGFQKAFNEVPEDMRNDEEVKHELHCRMRDFQEELWEICDRKRRNCFRKREEIVGDHWTTGQLVILINIYLALMEIEVKRFVDTVAVVEEYYAAIIKKDPRRERIENLRLQRVSFLDEERGERDDGKPKAPGLDKLELRKEVERILLGGDQESFKIDETNGFKTIRANIHFCQSFIDDVLSSALEFLKKNDKRSKETPPNIKKGKRPSKKSSKLQTTEDPGENSEIDKKLENALKEWSCVLEYEATRIKTLLSVLESAWKSDVEFLLTTIQDGLHLVEEKINEIYRKELKGIEEMSRVFCLAIEYHRSLPGDMILDGDRFLVNSHDSKDGEVLRSLRAFPTEEAEDLQFKMVQLGRLKDIFERVAPSGSLPRRSFIYILQDLIACGDEDNEPLVPPSWLKLEPKEVFELVFEVFGNDPLVDWRDFLVYAMNIDLPSQEQLLETLEHFRKRDESLSGCLPRAVFINIPVWFHKNLVTPSINSWLHEDFEEDEYELSTRTSSSPHSRVISLRPKSNKKSISFRIDEIVKKLPIEEITPQELRLNLAKELLSEIFLENNNVNYLKILLAFCRDQNPSKGLTGALTVVLNSKICGSSEDGEKFVEESMSSSSWRT
nr:PREDICTED: sperm flagellar protein 2-like [Fopius arisanus]